MAEPASILITGASRGIGAALARAYAGTGARLVLCGRDRARLDAVAETCRALGAEAHAEVADVADAAAMAALVARADAARPLDLVVANAGASAGTFGGGDDEALSREIFATNLGGVVNTVLPAVARMRARGGGQIAIMSSLASFVGVPGAAAYAASKAAVRVWGEGLRGRLAPAGIAVTVICPGYVATAMAAGNDFPMPLTMTPEAAARLIKRRLRRAPARIAFPLPLYLGARLAAALPPGLLAWIMARTRMGP